MTCLGNRRGKRKKKQNEEEAPVPPKKRKYRERNEMNDEQETKFAEEKLQWPTIIDKKNKKGKRENGIEITRQKKQTNPPPPPAS